MTEEIVRRVPLSDYATKELNRDLRCRDRLNKVITDMVIASIERIAMIEEDAWDEVARICGYDSNAAAIKDGVTFRISWARHEVDILKRREDDEDDCD